MRIFSNIVVQKQSAIYLSTGKYTTSVMGKCNFHPFLFIQSKELLLSCSADAKTYDFCNCYRTLPLRLRGLVCHNIGAIHPNPGSKQNKEVYFMKEIPI